MEKDVLYAVGGPVARVTLNRPRYRNAQSWRLLDQLDESLDRAMADDAVMVVVVDGAGYDDHGIDVGGDDVLHRALLHRVGAR